MLKLHRGYRQQDFSPLILDSARLRGSVTQLHHYSEWYSEVFLCGNIQPFHV